VNLAALNPDQSTDVNIPWNALGVAGSPHLIYATVDEGNLLEESDKSNNTRSVYVGPGSNMIYMPLIIKN